MEKATTLGSLIDISIRCQGICSLAVHSGWRDNRSSPPCWSFIYTCRCRLWWGRSCIWRNTGSARPVWNIPPVLMPYYVWHKILRAMFQWVAWMLFNLIDADDVTKHHNRQCLVMGTWQWISWTGNPCAWTQKAQPWSTKHLLTSLLALCRSASPLYVMLTSPLHYKVCGKFPWP